MFCTLFAKTTVILLWVHNHIHLCLLCVYLVTIIHWVKQLFNMKQLLHTTESI